MTKIIKELIKAENWPKALSTLREALIGCEDPDLLLKYGKYLSEIPPEAAKAAGYLPKRLAILGGYTTRFVARAAIATFFRRGLFVQVWESEYGLLESVIRSRDSGLAEFKPDLCYFCVGADHIADQHLESELARWKTLWQQTQDWLGCPIVQNTFEEPARRAYGHFELKAKNSRTRFIRALNLELVDQAASFVHFLDIDYLASLTGRRTWRDDKFYDLAKVATSQDFLAVNAEHLSRVGAAIFGFTKKCLVLDLDNTLWGGVVGDDGLGGIKIGEDSEAGEGFKRFQSYVRELKDRGVILAVCSKNDETNAKEPFEKRSDMVLKIEDISCFVANWEPKHLNIKRIAQELNIGLDSLVFADDNPVEREIVRQNLPEVGLVDMPLDPAYYAQALAESGFFETIAVTEEDRERTKQYLANKDRTVLEQSASSYEDFLRSLSMKAIVAPFDEENLPRIAQLINKTNQFNLTTKRYSEAEVRAMMVDPGFVTRYVKLRDRFGDNGLIAVMIARVLAQKVAEIDTWLMSCRVLKRDAEQLLLSDVMQELNARGVETVYGDYLPTKKNDMVKGLLAEMGFEKGADRWALPLRQAERFLAPHPVIEIVSNQNYGS